MLKSITLENYKCFKKLHVDDDDKLDIAPLTILCGVNSSGKSSILKSLMMVKQSFEDSSVSNSILSNGKYIDNGTFNEILSDNSTDKYFTISNSFEIQKKKNKITKDVTNYRDLCRLFYNTKIDKFFIDYSIKITNGGEFLYSNRIHEIKIKITVELESRKILSEIVLSRINTSVYSVRGTNIPDVSGQLGDFDITEATCYFSGMTLKSIYQEKMDSKTKLFIPAIISIFSIIPSQYLQIQYIAPLRENPKRRYVADKEVNYVGVSGENTPLLLKRLANNDWNGIVAPKSENDFCLSADNIIKDKFGNFINSWMNYLELGNVYLDNRQKELVKVKIDKHNIVDVGFGVSQALPIITEGIHMPQQQTLLLEQPEIHLHPKMQMRMADFLLSLTVQNKSVIVETHSDHFINRIVRRFMENENIRDKIKIYFIDKNQLGDSIITEVNIDDVDGAICENENFFYQFASETERIIDIGYKNLQKKQEIEVKSSDV